MKRFNLIIRKLLLKDLFYYTSAFLALVYAFICFNKSYVSLYQGDEENFNGTLINYTIKDDNLSFVISAKEDIKCNYYFKNDSDKNTILSNLKLGGKVNAKGKLLLPSKNTIRNTFNYREYLYNHGMFYTCRANELTFDNSSINFLYVIKNVVIDRINSFNKVSDYLYTFILGDKSHLDEEVMNAYKNNGVTHLFAISGMHIGLFSTIILFILKKIKIRENTRYIIVICFIWFYGFLTGFPSSVLRAGLLFTLLAFNKIFYTEIKTLNVLIMTGVILVFVKPFILKDIGFIYSFLTTFGLVYSSEVIKRHKIIGTSLIAFFSSLPFTINNFYEFNILSIFLNIIFVPFVSIIVYPLCLITFVFKFLEPITHLVLSLLEWFSSFVSNITLLKVVCYPINFGLIFIYYLIFLLGIKKRFKLTIVLLSFLIFINAQKNLLDNGFYVEFLDVGQGDSILIRTPQKRKTVLIDTGGIVSNRDKNNKNNYGYKVTDNTITYLKSLGVSSLSDLIISHGDYDHMGDAINLVENFKVEKVIFNCGPYNDLEKELIKVLDKKNIKYYSCIKELNIDNNILSFLQTKEYDNENDNSNVIYTELNGYKFMFMGDASITTEKEILNKFNLSDVDVLKVGHHGSKTSSSKEFIDEINPKYSIISVGKNNRYGHPNKEVLNNLQNTKIYRTDQDGSIMFKIKNNKLKIETCSP